MRWGRLAVRALSVAPFTRRVAVRRLAWGLGTILLVLGLWIVAFASANPASSVSCVTSTSGPSISVAQDDSGPWYSRSLPPLSDEIRMLTRNLYPGSSGRMVAYVKNVGRSPGRPTISISRLTDSGGDYTPPERRVEPGGDIGDLSANLLLTITYESADCPSLPARVIARGTLRELAATGRVYAAPATLSPSTRHRAEVGIWRIQLSVPHSADNRIQGDKTCCSVEFGLTQAR